MATTQDTRSLTQFFDRDNGDILLMSNANAGLSDPSKLRQQFARDGYLYLEQVIDAALIESIREQMLQVLSRHGYAVQGSQGWVFSGKTEGGLGSRSPEWLDAEYREMGLLAQLTQHQPLIDVLSLVVGEEVRFLPITEFRSRPPDATPSVYWHQDGFYSARGLDLYTVWIPLIDIEADLGGLAVAEGMHTGGYLHEDYEPPHYLVPPEAIPNDVHRRANYKVGDILVFDQKTPHTGLPNRTKDGLRFSIDTRFYASSDTGAVIGDVVEANSHFVIVRDTEGHKHRLTIDAESFLRDRFGDRFEASKIADSEVGPGSHVLVIERDATIVSLRPVSI